jgi:hypothetical protein
MKMVGGILPLRGRKTFLEIFRKSVHLLQIQGIMVLSGKPDENDKRRFTWQLQKTSQQ